MHLVRGLCYVEGIHIIDLIRRLEERVGMHALCGSLIDLVSRLCIRTSARHNFFPKVAYLVGRLYARSVREPLPSVQDDVGTDEPYRTPNRAQ